MKKLLLACMIALGLGAHAQTTVTIGTGTLSTSGTNGTPIYRSSATSSFNYSQSVQLLTASDLAAAGVLPGATITKIAYYKANAETMAAGRTATINLYMKNSALTALNTTTNFAGWTTGSTNVYSNTTFGSAATDLPAAAGWVEFNLTTPFQYTGGSIETAIDWAVNAGTGSVSTGAFSWQYTTATSAQAVGTSAGSPLTGNLSGSQTRYYNTQVTFSVTACSGNPAPGNTLSSFTPTCPGSYQTTLSAQNPTIGTGVTYQWYHNGTAIPGATSQSYNATVTAADSYYVAVTCGANTVNSNPITVTAPVSTLVPPYTNDFTTFPGACWTQSNGGSPSTGPAPTGTNYWFDDGFLNVGTTGAAKINLYSTNRTGWLISPAFNLTAGGYRVKFDYGLTDYAATGPSGMGADDVINFLISTNGGTSWTVLETWNAANTPSNSSNIYSYVIPAGSSVNDVKFAFYGSDGTVSDSFDYEFFVDNFVVEAVPSCLEPTAVTIGSYTATSVTLNWQAPTPVPANGYTVYYSTNNTAPTVNTVLNATNSVTSTTASATVSGLTAETTYYFWVRSECGATGTSPWVGPYSAYTGYCQPAPSSVDDLGITNVTFGNAPNIVNNSTGAEPGNYGNYSNMIGNVETGVATAVDITYETGYVYNTKIWVDLNNNLTFEASEELYSGASTSASPTVLAASITIPAGTPVGSYRMRIGGTWDVIPTVCYSGAYGSFEDYTINVVTAQMSTTEVDGKNAITLYPNPFTDFVTIDKANEVKAVTVFDVSGRMVKKVAKIEEKINTSDLQTGMYVFRIEMKDGSVKTVKAIKR